MPATASIGDIVDALEMQFDEVPPFLDLDTGQVQVIPVEILCAVEASSDDDADASNDDAGDDEWALARRILFTGNFRKLPTKFDVHEWSIMEDFALSSNPGTIQQELLDALNGAGAFRLFKSTILRLKIEKQWYAFRREALLKIAIDWCDEHQIPWR